MKKPLQILHENLPKVLANSHSMIISVIEIPENVNNRRFKVPQRVCYYLNYRPTHHQLRCIYRRYEIFKINKKNPDEKYEVIGDFLTNRFTTYPATECNTMADNNKSINETIKFFGRKDYIDTICLVLNPEHEKIELLYDRTGHLDVGKEFLEKMKKWRRIHVAAELTGNPKTIKQTGGFDLHENDDRELIEKMHQMDLNHTEPPERLFDFGKKIGSELKYLRSLI